MTRVVFCTISLLAAASAFGQVRTVEPTPTPVRVVVTNSLPAAKPPMTQPSPTPIVVGSAQKLQTASSSTGIQPEQPAAMQTATVPATTPIENLKFNSLSFRQLKNKIAEAKRLMQSRPIATASVNTPMSGESVRIAFSDPETDKIDYVVV